MGQSINPTEQCWKNRSGSLDWLVHDGILMAYEVIPKTTGQDFVPENKKQQRTMQHQVVIVQMLCF